MELQIETVESSALDTISRAEIDSQISTAKKYPRQLTTVKSNMLSFATLDEETAESCFYSLPRGGKNIQGPSVRLAEIAVSCYKNIRVGSRVMQSVTTGDNPHVIVQAICHDLENNVAVTIEKRRRITKKKSRDTIDEDDINLAANAGAAIAFRDAVFKVIPGALIKPVFEQAKKVAIGDAKTLGDRRMKSVEAFAKMGVSKDTLLAKLEKKSIEDIDLNDLETLIGLFNAIRDGQCTVDEAFPPAAAMPTFAPKKDAAKKSPPPPATTPATTTTPPAALEPKKPVPTVKAEPEPAPQPEPNQPEPAQPEPLAAQPEAPKVSPLDDLKAAMKEKDVTDEKLLAFAKLKNLIKEDADADMPVLSDIKAEKVELLTKHLRANGNVLRDIKAMQA